jgi:Ser/Thr protein kinase RdoA (MazF antagonist)
MLPNTAGLASLEIHSSDQSRPTANGGDPLKIFISQCRSRSLWAKLFFENHQGAEMTLYALANEACAHWNGTATRLIRNRENAVFEIKLPTGKAALRLHRQAYQDDQAIESELWWCGALAAQGVCVPAALKSRDGAYLVKLSNGRCASVIAWVEGEPLGEAGVPFATPLPQLLAQHHTLGRLIATLHIATDALVLPTTFSRPKWDINGLVGENPFWGRFWDHPAASAEQKSVLEKARAYLLGQLTQQRASGADFGPIHADVLRENVLVEGNKLSLIDFDDSGFGFRLYDLGTVMSQNLYEPAYAQIRDALIAGYASLRAVTNDMVEVHTLARTCASVGWTISRLAPDDPIHHSHIARAVMCANKVVP